MTFKKTEIECVNGVDVRLVVVCVNTVCHGMLQREDMHRLSLQNICRSSEELFKAPTPLLVGLHYACEDRNQQHFQTPATTEGQRQTEETSNDAKKVNLFLRSMFKSFYFADLL